MSTISASTTSTTAYKVTADTTGTLVLQTGSTPTTALTLGTDQSVVLGPVADAVGLSLQNSSYTTAYAADLAGNAATAGYGSQLQVVSPSDSSTVSGISLFTRTTQRSRWDILNVWTSSYLGDLVFRRRNGGTSTAEAMRIDSSGNLLVGTTSTGGNDVGFRAYGPYGSINSVTNTADYSVFNKSTSTTGTQIQFRSANSTVGSISSSSTTTTYATSSDYRLKENIAPMTGALAVVQQLKPSTYTWKTDGSDGQGFIAHELQEVMPDCVTGEKDAVDADGNPVYQGIDTSFLVATLTAAIQELKAELDAVKAQLKG